MLKMHFVDSFCILVIYKIEFVLDFWEIRVDGVCRLGKCGIELDRLFTCLLTFITLDQ